MTDAVRSIQLAAPESGSLRVKAAFAPAIACADKRTIVRASLLNDCHLDRQAAVGFFAFLLGLETSPTQEASGVVIAKISVAHSPLRQPSFSG
jgi:hypothetical protein